MPAAGDKQQRLEAAGIVKQLGDKLPDEYAAVIEGLTPDEVEVLIAVRKRLKEAERTSKKKIDEVFMAP
jgi:hypothetical protein